MSRKGKCLAAGARVKPGMLGVGTAAKYSLENSITQHINLLTTEVKFQSTFPRLTQMFKDLLPYLKTVLPSSAVAVHRTLIMILVPRLSEVKKDFGADEFNREIPQGVLEAFIRTTAHIYTNDTRRKYIGFLRKHFGQFLAQNPAQEFWVAAYRMITESASCRITADKENLHYMERAKQARTPNDAQFTIFELNKFDTCPYTLGWMQTIKELQEAEKDGIFADAGGFFLDKREGYMPMAQTATNLKNIIIIKLVASTYHRSTEITKLTLADFNLAKKLVSRTTGFTGYYNMITRLHKTGSKYPANFIMEEELRSLIKTFVEHYRGCIGTDQEDDSTLFPARDEGVGRESRGHTMLIRNIPLAMTSAYKKKAGLPLRVTLLSPRYIRKAAVSEADYQNLSEKQCCVLAHVMAHSRSVARLYYEQNQTDTLIKFLDVRKKTKKNAKRLVEGHQQRRAMPPSKANPDIERSLDVEKDLERQEHDDDFHLVLRESMADVTEAEPLDREEQLTG